MTAAAPRGPEQEYPRGSVRDLIGTDLVTPPTRAVLRARLEPRAPAPPRFFDAGSYATLRSACARLVPQPDAEQPVDLARLVDDRLADGAGDGWRYADLPPDADAYRRGLAGLDESAEAAFGASFGALDGARQDEVLRAVQRGTAPGPTWRSLPAARFFEELLAELVECYYSDPLAQEDIGYAGMADARGWEAVGLGRLEAWEPRPIGDGRG